MMAKFTIPATQYELTNMLGHLSPQDLNIKPNAMYLLFKLSVFMDNKFSCFPSLNHLCDVTGWSISTVALNIKALIDSGLIIKTQAKTSKSNFVNNTYTFNLKLFAKLTGLAPEQPSQLTQAPSAPEQVKYAKKLLKAYKERGALTKHQAKFLLASNIDLGDVSPEELKMCARINAPSSSMSACSGH